MSLDLRKFSVYDDDDVDVDDDDDDDSSYLKTPLVREKRISHLPYHFFTVFTIISCVLKPYKVEVWKIQSQKTVQVKETQSSKNK